MKNLKFLTRCNDKYTGIEYKEGEIHEFEDKRADEILSSSGFAKLVEETNVENEENYMETCKKAKKQKSK